ncbi:hypothetical protein GEMRC1_006448 [Eukaryota sp. GEM-RC1]
MSTINTIRVKVLVLGYSHSGKTTLISFLKDIVRHQPERFPNTVFRFLDSPCLSSLSNKFPRKRNYAAIVLVVDTTDILRKQTLIEKLPFLSSLDMPCVIALSKTDVSKVDKSFLPSSCGLPVLVLNSKNQQTILLETVLETVQSSRCPSPGCHCVVL